MVLLAHARRRAVEQPLVVVSALLGACVLLYLAADLVVSAGSRVLPESAEVRSNGTHFGNFENVAPDIVRRTAVVLALGALLSFIPFGRLSDTRRAIRWTGAGAIAVLTAVWIGWLADPHNSFSSNSRIHWVDIYFDRTDNFFYAAVKIPHFLFYDRPYMSQALTAALASLLFFEIGRRMKLPLAGSLGLAATAAISGNLLLFANTGEDVLLNVFLILLVIVAQQSRRPILLGLALGLVILGRPPFLVLTFAFLGGEFLAQLRRSRSLRKIHWRFPLVTGVSAFLSVVAWQLFFELLGDRYFLVNGSFVDAPTLQNIDPRAVDGFFISEFSGAYLGHALWVFPLPIIAGAVIGLVRARHRSVEVESLVYACALAVAALFFVNEKLPNLYYNIRYLTYYLPLLLVMAWSVFAPRERDPVNSGFGVTLRRVGLGILLVAPLIIPADPVGERRAIEQRFEHELTAISVDIDALVGDERLYVEGRSTRNYVSYLLQRDVRSIKLLTDEPPERGVVIVRQGDLATGLGGDVALRTDTYVVVVIGGEASS